MWICFGGFRRRCEDASWGSTGNFTDPSNLMPAVKFPAARRGFVIPAEAEILRRLMILHLKATLSMKRVEIQAFSGSWIELAPFV